MRLLATLPFFLCLCACSHTVGRGIASLGRHEVTGEVDPAKTILRFFPQESADREYLFYLEPKDADGRALDVRPSDLRLSRHRTVQLDRLSQGRYTIRVTSSKIELVSFKLQGKNIPNPFRLIHRPQRELCVIKIIAQNDHTLDLELTLRDHQNLPLDSEGPPEVLVEGIGEIESLEWVKKGSWRMRLRYPEMNQILYVSVRANGIYLPRLFRLQHIEK
jgi:hypothetical protein